MTATSFATSERRGLGDDNRDSRENRGIREDSGLRENRGSRQEKEGVSRDLNIKRVNALRLSVNPTVAKVDFMNPAIVTEVNALSQGTYKVVSVPEVKNNVSGRINDGLKVGLSKER